MITYVINTSANRTFDSDQLFRLADYKKIHWLNVSLDKIDECIEYIKTKQGAIESEEFRVSVLVDFFNFDRIRRDYGRDKYVEEKGVECSLYLPYIEGYLKDKLFFALEKEELFAKGYEVFYIKGGKLEVVENVSNLQEQINQIIEPDESTYKENRKHYRKDKKTVYVSLYDEKKVLTEEEYEQKKSNLTELNKKLYENLSNKEKEEVYTQIQEINDLLDELKAKESEVKSVEEERTYTVFKLHCTKTMSLTFDINDFPYVIDCDKEKGISTRQFFEAFLDRIKNRKEIRRYFYETSLGGSPAKAAFENLALSLNLVRLYEREDEFKEEGVIDVKAIDPKELKNLLLTAWNKIVQAEKIAKENNSLYYSLKNIYRNVIKKPEEKKLTPQEEFDNIRAKITIPNNKENDSIEKQYSLIMGMGKKGEKKFIDQDKKDFDEILTKYLLRRNEMTEKEIEQEFQYAINSGRFETTNQCPPRQECDYVIGQKQDEISRLMSKVLEAEYSAQKFEEEKKSATEYYEKYTEAKKIVQRGTIGDIIFFILTLAVIIVPYIIAKNILGFNFGTIIVYIICIASFFGLLLLSFLISILPAIKRIRDMKYKMRECYKDCLAKKKLALEALRIRYQVDLINIEECRYEIRQINRLYQLNMKKNKCVNMHRKTLDEMENCLGTILNNLGVHPILDDEVSVENEFNINKSIRSHENKVYKVFSLDAIESLLVKDKKVVM